MENLNNKLYISNSKLWNDVVDTYNNYYKFPCPVKMDMSIDSYCEIPLYEALHMLFIFSVEKTGSWKELISDDFNIGMLARDDKPIYPILLSDDLLYRKVNEDMWEKDTWYSIVEKYGDTFFNGGKLKIQTQFLLSQDLIKKIPDNSLKNIKIR